MAKSRKQIVTEKITEYEKVYDVSAPNDKENVKNLVELELERERLSNALRKISPAKNPRMVKAIHDSLKDVNESYLNLTKELDISRSKRSSEDEDNTPKKDIERNQKVAETMLDKRMKVITCPSCGQVLCKYFITIEDNQIAEPGSITYDKNKTQPMKYTLRVQCWKCASVHPVHHPNDTYTQEPPKEVIAKIGTETYPIIQ